MGQSGWQLDHIKFSKKCRVIEHYAIETLFVADQPTLKKQYQNCNIQEADKPESKYKIYTDYRKKTAHVHKKILRNKLQTYS